MSEIFHEPPRTAFIPGIETNVLECEVCGSPLAFEADQAFPPKGLQCIGCGDELRFPATWFADPPGPRAELLRDFEVRNDVDSKRARAVYRWARIHLDVGPRRTPQPRSVEAAVKEQASHGEQPSRAEQARQLAQTHQIPIVTALAVVDGKLELWRAQMDSQPADSRSLLGRFVLLGTLATMAAVAFWAIQMNKEQDEALKAAPRTVAAAALHPVSVDSAVTVKRDATGRVTRVEGSDPRRIAEILCERTEGETVATEIEVVMAPDRWAGSCTRSASAERFEIVKRNDRWFVGDGRQPVLER